MNQKKYDFQDLLSIMQRLRAADGCPWDRKQTHESIKKHVVEEAYELVEAIDSGDNQKIADESGDVLLQVVFHAQIAAEEGGYDIDDVTDAICRKMIHRHPHLFGTADEPADWDEIKRRDRSQATVAEEMRGVSAALPALMRAEKILRKAEKAGYTAPQTGDFAMDELGLGALLFQVADQCRKHHIDPELALSRYLNHYITEFEEKENQQDET